jgi:hypothetical protein
LRPNVFALLRTDNLEVRDQLIELAGRRMAMRSTSPTENRTTSFPGDMTSLDAEEVCWFAWC